MDRKRLKFVLLGAGILLSMGLLLAIGVNQPGGFVYYMTVTEFLENDGGETDGFRVNGKVEQGSIERTSSGQDVTFVITDGTSELMVQYHGIIPDTFVDGADVVVEGQLENDQVFYAHNLLAKCPSKYESAEDGANHPEGYPIERPAGTQEDLTKTTS